MRFTDVRWVAEVGSTNTELLAEARAGAPEGVVLVADHQTAGRGRLDRRWESPPGASLLVSVLLRPSVPLERAHLVKIAGALAAADAVRDVAGVDVALKWPNDLVVGDKKLAGLLAESVVEAGEMRALVVGMGLNLEAEPAEGATSLRREASSAVDRQVLLDAWLTEFDARLDDLPGVLADYRARCSTLGADVRVSTPRGELAGRALDVTDAGHLLVDVDGTVHELAVGDVVHVRRR